jgi:glycosidase
MIVEHSEYQHSLELDDTTGLPKAVILRGTERRIGLHDVQMSLTVAGNEVRSATGGIDYEGAYPISAISLDGAAQWSSSVAGDKCSIPINIGEVAAKLEFLFRRHGAAMTIGLVLVGDPSSKLLIRNLTVSGDLHFATGKWLLNAPGNGIARDTPFGKVTAWTGISAIGGLRGSSAVVHFASQQDCAALWFRHELEVSDIRIKSERENVLSLEINTNFAGDLGRISSANIDLFDLDLRVPEFQDFSEWFQTWLRQSGHTTPQNPPAWIGSASIYEAQVGFSVFYPDHRYEPYADIAALTADLERIAALGFNVIQLMPRQPYPSYNVHDYWDIQTSFGDLEQMRLLIGECHDRGIKIILDVLLHGVLDQESIAAAADGVRAGPYAGLVSSNTSDSFSADVGEWSDYLIAWSRHIIDFEPYWKAGSPPVSPLIAEHPDWFFKDSHGNVAGIYTKAFDARNPQWQVYFIDAMKFLLSDLEIDGFRFDAPTYNDFPNWADWARHRASLSTLACVPLFEHLRPALKAIKPDSLMYTEPSGILLRRSMDLNYNYDEQWLVTAISDPSKARTWGVRDARGLARWIQDRDAFLPRGSLTAHHIDSHDTFWWPSWGAKWRREQFSLAHAQLLTLIFMSLPGPFMMFTGGEHGIEQVLEGFNHLKQAMPDWAELNVRWLNDDSMPEDVFGMVRSQPQLEIITLVNLANEAQILQIPSNSRSQNIRLTVGQISRVTSTQTGLSFELPARSGIVLEASDHG